MINLDQVEPSPEARKRAEAAGINLNALKLEQPEQFMIFVSEAFLSVSEVLLARASDVFSAALPHHQLVKLNDTDLVTLKAFPALTKTEEERVISALGRLVEHPKFEHPLAHVRTISDKTGEHHQFALPLRPLDWAGQVNRLIGPFDSEQAVQDWTETHVRQADLSSDSLPYAGAWFCDVFKNA